MNLYKKHDEIILGIKVLNQKKVVLLIKNVLAVDVAKNKSMFLLINSDGEILIDTIELTHNKENFNYLKNIIDTFNLKTLTIFMESTSTYHLPVEKCFKDNNYNTLVINGLLNKNNYNSLRKTKTDRKDCYNLANLFFLNKIPNNNLPKDDFYYNLKILNRQYNFLIEQNVRFKNRFRRLVNLSFPEYESIFKGQAIFENTSLNFIKEFPHADIISNKRIDALTNNLFKTNERHKNYYLKLANKIKAFTNNSFPEINSNSTDVDNLIIITKMLQNNINEIQKIKTKMLSLPQDSSLFKVINSFYGIGELTAVQLLAELGDITRFDNVK